MLNSRMKWILALLVIFFVTLSCSKKEEESRTEGVKQETPAEQKSAMTEQSPDQPRTDTAREEGERMAAAGKAEETAAEPAEKTAEEPTAANGRGEEVYQQTCVSCHGTGVAGAPKTGDKEAWSSLIAKGEDLLVQNAVNGIGAMPPKGGNPSLSEEEVRAAVNYMIEQSR